MNTVQRLYDALARVLTYPDQSYRTHLVACFGALGDQHPEASRWMHQFAQHIAPLSVEELQELFTRTFDLNPVCSLEIGWHLFGENYSRGEFLVEMRQTLRRLGLTESTELPDHLSQVLPTVARLQPRDADRFTTQHLLPALEKMLAGLRGKVCPYEFVLEAIRAVVLSPYGAVVDIPPVADAASVGMHGADASCVGYDPTEVAHG